MDSMGRQKDWQGKESLDCHPLFGQTLSFCIWLLEDTLNLCCKTVGFGGKLSHLTSLKRSIVQ